MLNVLLSILGILITLLIIIGFHEFGHFIVARLAGVKVLRFSIGFGKALFRWHDKKGTEYVFAAIPLGGYVKMLDENEENVSPDEKHLAFNRQSLFKKFLIVAAGPVANLVLAFFLYWLLFVIGFNSIVPVIGEVTPHSIAANAGLKPQQKIISVDEIPTFSWMGVSIRILSHVGNNDTLVINTQTLTNPSIQNHLLNLSDWHLDNLKPDPLASLGFTPYEPNIPAIIGTIQVKSPAETMGLKIGDKIIAINNKKMTNWLDMLDVIHSHPNETLQFTLLRQNKIEKKSILIGSEGNWFGQKHGFLGISPQFNWPTDLIHKNKYNVLTAIPHAWRNVADFTTLNLMFIGKLLTGKASMQSLGGPIAIFQGAGSAFQEGIAPFLGFLAFLSISIGIINIFPIPGLDGGHVLFQLIELIIRRPIPERVMNICYRLGLILLLLLISQAIVNDIHRLS